MMILGLVFPFIILAVTKTFFKTWRSLKLFSGYLLIYAALELMAQMLGLSFYTRLAIVLFFGLLEVSNLEHVINNNSNQNLAFIKFIFDPVFLKGSGLTKRFFIRLAVIEILLTVLCIYSFKLEPIVTSIVLGISLFITLVIPSSSVVPDWLQENWIIFNLRVKKAVKSALPKENVKLSLEKLKSLDEEYQAIRPRENGENG